VARAAGTRDAREAFASRIPRARRAVKAAVEALGIAIGGVFSVLQPERFVLAGGMAMAGPKFLAAVRRDAASRVFAEYRRNLDIVLATLGNDAGWIGAALVAATRDA